LSGMNPEVTCLEQGNSKVTIGGHENTHNKQNNPNALSCT
jgi:hypothetical protein